MRENFHNNNNCIKSEIPQENKKEIRPKSTNLKKLEPKVHKVDTILKIINEDSHKYNFSLDKSKFNKNQTKLAKILLMNDSKFSLKLYNFHNKKLLEKEKESNKTILDDKAIIKNLEEKIKEQKKIIEEKKNKERVIKDNIIKLKESIIEKEKNIEKTNKNINEYIKLNEDLSRKINEIKIKENNNDEHQNINEESGLYLDGFDNSREREEIINNLISIGMNYQESYPNVDNMTYEELLELEERIGKVNNGLNDDEIKNLKHEKFIKYKYLEDKCIICQYDFKELESIIVLCCNHCFHFDCIKPWIIKQHYCPYCKTNLRKEKK